MATHKEVAEWMFGEIGYINISQLWLANEISKVFGNEYIYYTVSGNIAINKDVLKEFRKISKGQIDWDKGSKAWRKKRDI